MADIVLDQVTKTYSDGYTAVKDLDLEIERRRVHDPRRARRAAGSRPR